MPMLAVRTDSDNMDKIILYKIFHVFIFIGLIKRLQCGVHTVAVDN